MKALKKMLAQYKNEPDRIKIMLNSINSYLLTIFDAEKDYADGTIAFPINKSGNIYLDAAIKEIQEITKQGKGDSEELKEIAKFVAKKLDISKPEPEMKKSATKKETAKSATKKETNTVKKGASPDLTLLDGAISNVNRAQGVLNKRPFNPVDLPSARTHIDACVEKLKALKEALIEVGG